MKKIITTLMIGCSCVSNSASCLPSVLGLVRSCDGSLFAKKERMKDVKDFISNNQQIKQISRRLSETKRRINENTRKISDAAKRKTENLSQQIKSKAQSSVNVVRKLGSKSVAALKDPRVKLSLGISAAVVGNVLAYRLGLSRKPVINVPRSSVDYFFTEATKFIKNHLVITGLLTVGGLSVISRIKDERDSREFDEQIENLTEIVDLAKYHDKEGDIYRKASDACDRIPTEKLSENNYQNLKNLKNLISQKRNDFYIKQRAELRSYVSAENSLKNRVDNLWNREGNIEFSEFKELVNDMVNLIKASPDYGVDKVLYPKVFDICSKISDESLDENSHQILSSLKKLIEQWKKPTLEDLISQKKVTIEKSVTKEELSDKLRSQILGHFEPNFYKIRSQIGEIYKKIPEESQTDDTKLLLNIVWWFEKELSDKADSHDRGFPTYLSVGKDKSGSVMLKSIRKHMKRNRSLYDDEEKLYRLITEYTAKINDNLKNNDPLVWNDIYRRVPSLIKPLEVYEVPSDLYNARAGLVESFKEIKKGHEADYERVKSDISVLRNEIKALCENLKDKKEIKSDDIRSIVKRKEKIDQEISHLQFLNDISPLNDGKRLLTRELLNFNRDYREVLCPQRKLIGASDNLSADGTLVNE